MADDLVVFSWNLEKKSYGGLTSNADNVSRVVDNIADVVSTGDKGAETPFVGFLLEITGADANVAKLCRTIEAEYRKKTGQDVTVTSRSTDGSPNTRESIIVMSRGVEVTPTKFDVQSGIRTFINRDKQNADRLHEERRASRPRRSNYDDHPYARPKPEHNRKLNRETDWFRNGTVADVKQGDRTYRIATVHAPGPDVSDKVKEVVDSIVDTAWNSRVDILIGDLNRRGSMPKGHYEDLSKGWKTGTTFGRNEPDQLGKTQWDRVLAPETRTFDIISPEPVAVLRPVDLGKRLSDHALVYARVSNRTVPQFNSGATEPFSSPTGEPRPGADLHSLASSKAQVQPADPTLLYSAASDRKSSSEQLQKQLEDNPLTSNPTQSAGDPLSPPSATSPLTEPPPTSGSDVAMEESAEAMDAMAAEGSEVADLAEVLLL